MRLYEGGPNVPEVTCRSGGRKHGHHTGEPARPSQISKISKIQPGVSTVFCLALATDYSVGRLGPSPHTVGGWWRFSSMRVGKRPLGPVR